MSEMDLPARLARDSGTVNIVRLALQEHDLADLPPSRWRQSKDPRYRWFKERYGDECWELDALSPVLLRNRVEEAIRDRLDHEAWGRAEVTERAELESLATVLQAWPGISGQASKYPGQAWLRCPSLERPQVSI